MFLGFKTPTIGLKQTATGPSLVIPYGTAAGRWTDSANIESSLNNLVIGSGWGIAINNFTPSTNNIVIGVTDSITSPSAIGQIQIKGSRNVILIPDPSGIVAGINSLTSWGMGNSQAQSTVVIGCYNTATAPGLGSVSIGSAIGTGGNAIAIGTSSQASNTSCIAIGDNTVSTGSQNICIGSSSAAATPGTQNIAIGISATSSSSGGGIAIGYSSFATSSGHYYPIAIGNAAIASSDNCIAIGQGTNTNTKAAAIAIGYQTKNDGVGQIAFCTGGFAAVGDMQTLIVPLYCVTASTSTTQLYAGQATNTTTPSGNLTLAINSSYIYEVQLVGGNQTNGTGGALASGLVSVGATIATGTHTANTNTLFGASAPTAFSISYDSANGALKFSVTAPTATSTKWGATVRLTKIT